MTDVCLATSKNVLPFVINACAVTEPDFAINLDKFCTPGPCNDEWRNYFIVVKGACPDAKRALGEMSPESCCANKQACIQAANALTAAQGGQPATGSIDPAPTGSTTNVSATASAASSATSSSAESSASAGSSETSSSASPTATSTAASGETKSSAKALNKSVFSLAVMNKIHTHLILTSNM
ncbi:hypothetical protein HK099_000634 [Clydaea vesicula]|uniref:Uncharacterized protein n=1 Tax=Clydaea vesicula TaxID=447962 RepID=A0AAD5TXJ5_9FUNG|nr:hypothetical protein HK099_000634 [Clydaea vesicula]